MSNPYKLNIQYRGLLNGAEQLFQPAFDEFVRWITGRKEIQFDVETNIVKEVRERKLITLQFGSVGDSTPTQWGFQWSYLNDEEKSFIKCILEDDGIIKIIQNAAFEIVTCLNYDIHVRGVFDTMLAERILWCGYSGEFQVSAALEDIADRRLLWKMSKDEQLNFGDNIITTSKVEYMGRDVLVLDKIKKLQLLELHLHNLEFVAALENEAVIGFAQMMWEGMKLNKEKWLANVEWAKPLIEEAEQKLDEWLEKEPFRSRAIKLGYINEEDKLLINWRSNNHKRLIAKKVLTGCEGATKAIVEKWMPTVVKCLPLEQACELQELGYEYLNGTTKPKLEAHLLKYHRQWLIDNELLRPAGTAILNWNSVEQVLPLIRIVDPRLKNMNSDSMGKFTHPIGLDIEKYKEKLKLVSTYGESFLKYVDSDCKVRTSFNQIMTTGRVSSSDPNMQNVTVKEFTAILNAEGKVVGQRYRNCFEPDDMENWEFVSSDYVSQELATIAYLTRDKNWIEAIRKGQDLHSIASELVFGSDQNPYHISWKNAAEKDCAYYKPTRDVDGKVGPAKVKCKCTRHKVMRDACKNINFGLAYGMTKYRLAAMLRIPIRDAQALIDIYYKAMPAIGKTMTYLGRFGVRNGYIQTMAPFFRKRWFPKWKGKERYIDEHISGIREDWALSSIEKESKNMPIQGSSADCTKIAICLVMWELDEKQLHDRVRLVMQVHDQLDTIVRKDFSSVWKKRLTEIMEEAALVVIPNGLLKAETTITPVWSK